MADLTSTNMLTQACRVTGEELTCYLHKIGGNFTQQTTLHWCPTPALIFQTLSPTLTAALARSAKTPSAGQSVAPQRLYGRSWCCRRVLQSISRYWCPACEWTHCEVCMSQGLLSCPALEAAGQHSTFHLCRLSTESPKCTGLASSFVDEKNHIITLLGKQY